MAGRLLGTHEASNSDLGTSKPQTRLTSSVPKPESCQCPPFNPSSCYTDLLNSTLRSQGIAINSALWAPQGTRGLILETDALIWLQFLSSVAVLPQISVGCGPQIKSWSQNQFQAGVGKLFPVRRWWASGLRALLWESRRGAALPPPSLHALGTKRKTSRGAHWLVQCVMPTVSGVAVQSCPPGIPSPGSGHGSHTSSSNPCNPAGCSVPALQHHVPCSLHPAISL